jgi:hypothetical protein
MPRIEGRDATHLGLSGHAGRRVAARARGSRGGTPPVHGLKAYVESVVACARGEIHHLDIIPSVQPWAPDEIRERARNAGAEPSRSDRIRAFSQFLNAERHVLQKLASHPHSFVQHAYNSANSGPVAAAAEAIIEAETQPVFLLRSPHQRPAQNPDPALIRTIEVPGGAIEGVIAASTAGGDVGLTSYGARVVHVWDLETGKRLHTLEGHENRVTCVSVTPDGRRAISGGADDALCVWDLESGRPGLTARCPACRSLPTGKGRSPEASRSSPYGIWRLPNRCS